MRAALRIIGATLTPFGDSFAGTPFEGYYTPEKEKIRVALNAFIRSGAFDGVIDFDKVIVDPQKPGYSLREIRQGRSSPPERCWLRSDGRGDRSEYDDNQLSSAPPSPGALRSPGGSSQNHLCRAAPPQRVACFLFAGAIDRVRFA